MAIRTLLEFRSLDLTRKINDRYTDLLGPGVFEDTGSVIPVPAQLKVDLVAPWKLVTKDGMVVEETFDNTRLDTPAGQTTVIAVKAVYVANNDPIVEVLAIELSAFNLLADIDDHIVFAHVVVPIAATSVLSSYISLSPRQIVDKLGRRNLRGVVTSTAFLPPAEDNLDGDYYVVAPGSGAIPHLYGWDGLQWLILTDAATVTSDLSLHRSNSFIDEKHATDDEKLALQGTSGSPSDTNRYVTNEDPRVPTQDENDALAGSDGSPSSSNLYITQEFVWAVPEEKIIGSAPVSPAVEILPSEGPVYVGQQGVGTSNQYFKFYDSTENREYTTASGSKVVVSGVFTDSLLTSPLDPSIDPNVDAKGFYTTNSLFVAYDITPDTGFRLAYGLRKEMKLFPVDALLKRTTTDCQTSSDAITTVEAIKGRDWDDTPPVNEQNIELRKDIVDTREYLNSVFKADYVAFDFDKVDGIPDFNQDFINNIGIPPNYTFENTGLVTFTYDSTTGRVTFASTIANGSVVPGNVFIDGATTEFIITAIPSGTEFDITARDGTIPLTLNTTVTSSEHGSAKPDNNPRKINLSTFDYVVGRERITAREIELVPNEYHPSTGNVAFQIRSPLRSAFFREPRIRFYGGFQNRDSANRKRIFASNTGIILVTGFFTDLHMLVDIKASSPSVTVKIDGDPTGTVVDLTRGATVADLGTEQDIQQQVVEVAAGLADLVPHTVQIEVGNASDEFIIYGFDLWRSTVTTTAMLPGRAFVQADLVKNDSIVTFSTPIVSQRSRGAVSTRFINRSTFSQQQTTTPLTDYDGAAGGPAGVAVAATTTFTVSGGLVKFQNYRPKDVVKVITATTEEIKQIDTITGVGVIDFTTTVVNAGAAILLHVCSTEGDSPDLSREYIRYNIQELGVAQEGVDFGALFFVPSDRLYTVEDGTTSILGKNVQYTTTGIDGVSTALEMVDGTSTLRIRAVGVRMDLLTANTTGLSVSMQIDGCPAFSKTIPGGGLTKVPVWTNARYQTHEVYITAASGLRVVGIILHEPIIEVEGTTLATQNIVADHDSSLEEDGDVIPTGCVAVDPHVMGGVYVNGGGVGSDWNKTIDYTVNPFWGRLIQNDREASYFEYFFLGSGFECEYLARNDYGRPVVFINGVLATAANFPGATFKGVDSANGKVDMYDPSATAVRKKFSIIGLAYGKIVVRIAHQTPRDKNAASLGTIFNVGTFYEISDSRRLSYSPSRGFRGTTGIDDFVYGMDWVRDERNFDSGAIAREEVPVIRQIIQPTRAQNIALAVTSTSITVSFSTPFDDNDYALTAVMLNTTDALPEYQPITITAKSPSGFTANWNDPLDTANYSLSYTAIKFL